MNFRVIAMNTPAHQKSGVQKAVRVLKSGGLIILPTETVYGLCADPASQEAMLRVIAAKGRDVSKPIAWLVDGPDRVIESGAHFPDTAKALAAAFWPGPLTMVLDMPSGRTQGFRVPAHEIALAVLCEWSAPLAATSANRSGHEDPVNAVDAIAEVGGHADLALDAGPSPGGRASTVVRVEPNGAWSILREGALSRHQIKKALA